MSMRKPKSIFAIEAITTESNRYPVREVRRDTVGYFSTLAKAEKGLQAFIYGEKIYEKDLPRHEWDLQHIGYIIYERPLDLHAGSDMTFLSARNYSADGELICESLTPDDAAEYEFFGRKAEDARFHHGDIVESTQFGYAELCIVDLIPTTPERIAERRERAKRMHPDYWETLSRLDYTDDCYLVYSLGEGDTHSHPRSYNVFPPSKPVSKEMAQQLKDKLAEMDKLHENEFGNGSHV